MWGGNTKRLQGFTIVELLVVLILSIIIVSAGFYALRLIQGQFHLFRQTTNEVTEYRSFAHQLKAQTLNSKYVEVEPQRLFFLNDQHEVIYEFQDEFVLRSSDTLEIEIDTFFVKSHISFSSLKSVETEEGLIDYFQIILDMKGEIQSTAFSKQYSAVDLINYEDYGN
ncbi:MAG: hypothetical protein DWQ02_12640 [Bacteroidetes bacterium]|nr:MAG: hypothetical protein DWQ02_12640 [Bacteroidota bacterium]